MNRRAGHGNEETPREAKGEPQLPMRGCPHHQALPPEIAPPGQHDGGIDGNEIGGDLQERMGRGQRAPQDPDRGGVEADLTHQQGRVPGGVGGQGQIGREGEQQEERDQPAQQLVTEILVGEKSVPQWIEKLQVAEKYGQATQHRADLAVKLPPAVGNIEIIADRRGVAHTAQAEPHAVEQGPEVALHVRGKIPADLASGGEKGTAQSDEGIDLTLQPAQPHFVAHIGPFSARAAVLVKDAVDAADAAYGGVGEIGDDLRQPVGVELGRHIREDKNFSPRHLNRLFLGIFLAAAGGHRQKFHPLLGIGFDNTIGGVGGAVGGDQDLQHLPRVFQRQGIFEFFPDALFLVISRNDQSDQRKKWVFFYFQPAHPSDQQQRQGIAEIGEEHQK